MLSTCTTVLSAIAKLTVVCHHTALYLSGELEPLPRAIAYKKVQVIKVSCGRYLTHSNVIVAASEPLVTISDRTLTNYSVLQLSRF